MAILTDSWRKLRAKAGPTVAAVLVTLVAVHVLFLLMIQLLHVQLASEVYWQWLALSWSNLAAGRVWTLLTYAALHDLGDPMHILFNCLGLFWFGAPIERQWGRRGVLQVLLIAVLFGALMQLAADGIAGQPGATVGASAGLMGLLAVFAWTNPNLQILLFFVLPIRARWLVAVVLGIDFITWASGSHIAFWAHVGGVLGGWVVLHKLTSPKRIVAYVRALAASYARSKGMRSRFDVLPGGRSRVDSSRRDRDRANWN